MKRLPSTPRPGWQQKVEALGFVYHSVKGGYWNEAAYYEFTAEEIEEIETATHELHQLCLEAVEHVIKKELLYRFQVPPDMYDLVRASWKNKDSSLYGRFDLAYDGVNGPKMMEYNADTPTGLLEAADVQEQWKNELHPNSSQYNRMRHRLTSTWKKIAPKGARVHFSCMRHSSEDFATVDFLRLCAEDAGLNGSFLYLDEIGWDGSSPHYLDKKDRQIDHLFKLYPWEWLCTDRFSSSLHKAKAKFIEPMWKMILSNKAILPILWELFPEHPYLLPASFYPNELKSSGIVRKPLLSREGANVSIKTPDIQFETSGVYGEEGYVYQEFFPLPKFDEFYPIIGSWCIGGNPSGIGVREDRSLVTKNSSWFAPHLIRS